MKTCKSMRKAVLFAVLFALVLAGAGALVTVGSGEVKAQLATHAGAPVLAETAVTPVGSTVVPDVLDLSESMARQEVQAAGLVLRWTGNSNGPVVYQAPKAGTTVALGSTVWVSLKNY